MNAIEDNASSRAWKRLGEEIPRPSVILSISAHWETRGTKVTGMAKPRTIYDFWGFPDTLYKMKYPAAGSPALAKLVAKQLVGIGVGLDTEWGLDHGTWIVLARMYPRADIPVVQLSLDYTVPGQKHFEIGKSLAELRERGVLILGSGNIVHNLGMMQLSEGGYDWAIEFDEMIKRLLIEGKDATIIDYEALPRSHLPIPTPEHFLPLLYIIGAKHPSDRLRFVAENIVYGSVSMRCAVFE
nr:4,5-DOPA dioxygenase extradiol [Candidatus Sigynarchaeota archaeon]